MSAVLGFLAWGRVVDDVKSQLPYFYLSETAFIYHLSNKVSVVSPANILVTYRSYLAEIYRHNHRHYEFAGH